MIKNKDISWWDKLVLLQNKVCIERYKWLGNRGTLLLKARRVGFRFNPAGVCETKELIEAEGKLLAHFNLKYKIKSKE
mgnify:CR=1 FL=1